MLDLNPGLGRHRGLDGFGALVPQLRAIPLLRLLGIEFGDHPSQIGLEKSGRRSLIAKFVEKLFYRILENGPSLRTEKSRRFPDASPKFLKLVLVVGNMIGEELEFQGQRSLIVCSLLLCHCLPPKLGGLEGESRWRSLSTATTILVLRVCPGRGVAA